MKQINFDVELKSTSLQRQFVREKAMTNDLNSVDINYKISDMTDEDLTDATAQVLLYMQDGSFFQVPNEKITLTGTTFTYALEEAPGNHAGIVRTQVVVKTSDLKEYASQKLEFEIISGLETQVATEVMIQDWTTLTREARAYIDEFELIVNDAKSQVEANILETAVEEKFDGLEAEYATDLTQVKTQLAESTTLLNQAIANVTVDSEVITARNSGVKGKTFIVLDERLEELELEHVDSIKPFHFNHASQEYVNIDKFYEPLKNGKIYTTEFYKFDVSPSSTGVKKENNEGLVCEPSTNIVKGRNDYENIGLFKSIDVNAYVDENDDYHVIAIDGDGRFKNDGSMGDVYVMAMPGYQKRYETDTVWGISYSDTMHSGFEILGEAVKPDGTIRPYLLHAKYIAGRNPYENNNLASISGVYAEYDGMSHDGQIDKFKEKGIQYSGKTSHDDYYVQLMFWLKYATLNSDTIIKGCQSYYLQYANLVAETGVKRVVITNSQANELLMGSTVSIGDYGVGSINADRQVLQNYNLANRVKILDIVDLLDGNSAVYVDSANIFDTTLTTTITTYPWNSGGCDNVLGQDGSPYNNRSGKEPFIINGIEMMVGGYEVLQNLIIHNNSVDNRTDVYVCYDCTKYSKSSPNVDYALVGQMVTTDGKWKYGSKMLIPQSHPSVILITEAGASSTTGTGDGVYTNPTSSGGYRVWLSLGHLNHGAVCGLRCLFAHSGLAYANWLILGRLSATGRSMG